MTGDERRRRLKVARLRRRQTIALRQAAREGTRDDGEAAGRRQTTVAVTGAGTMTTGQRS
ncbi:MAG TPA: hypothetical protein VHO27_05915 [Angustibacter sp.]|nr:hypothetical protein [Angustibacter sp.]